MEKREFAVMVGLSLIIFCTFVLTVSAQYPRYDQFRPSRYTDNEPIKCWICRSDHDPHCADPFDNTTVHMEACKGERLNDKNEGTFKPPIARDVSDKYAMCRKIRQRVNGQWRFIRGCAWFGEPGIDGDERYCLMRTGTWDIHIEYCTCWAKDGCNGASGKVPSAGTTAFLLLAFLASSYAARCYL